MTKPKPPTLKINASAVAYAHAVLAYSAFIGALIVGCWLHYYKIVENSSYGYPDEWFPSVSATIGDRYPERALFQLLIACTSGPRFLLIFLNYVVLSSSGPGSGSIILLISGLLRTLTCGGWVYITSTDDHDWHDIFMISYIVLTIPWTISVSVLSPKKSTVRMARVATALTFFFMLIPLVYFFIQHKVHVVAGAYSYYAYFEWALILLDVGFDACSVLDLDCLDILISPNLIKTVKRAEGETESATEQTSKKGTSKNEIPKSSLSGPNLPSFIVSTINSFMFWTALTSLLVCVWYFPLWHMGISGYEAVIAVMFIAPLLLLIPPLSFLFTSFPQIPRLLTVALGLGAFKIEEPEHRLLTITAGVGFGVISIVSEMALISEDPKKSTESWISLLLGLLASSVSKYANHSNNPAWPIMNKDNGGHNEVFIAIGIIAALMTKTHTKAKSSTPRSGGSFLLASVGLGSLLFSMQAFLSDSSTLVYWNWEGYPIRGPLPLDGGLIHFGVFIAGILASVSMHPNFFLSSIYSFFALGNAYVLYNNTGWLGFFGSLGLTFYVASLGPLTAQAIAGYNFVALFSAAFFISVLLSLASVWIVAYAFVPGGPLLRERTDIVLFSAVLCLGAISVNYLMRKSSSNITRIEVFNSTLFSNTLKIVTGLLAICGTTYYYRIPATPFKPYNSESKSFTAGIWCVHFGLDNDMWSSETRMRDLIRDAEVDIIGLLETDTERLIGGNRDFTQKIADDLGMYVDYGPGPNKHTWGAALLSKFPIVESSHHLLPSPVGELAPAILATLDIYGELIDVVVFHSGQEEDVEDRRLQSLGIQEIMGNSTRPLVLLSYLVTEPLKGNYNTYVSEKSRMYDIDNTDWDRWCEYILFRELKKVAYARISRSTITDTELQIAKFKFLTEEQKTFGDSFLYGNHYVSEDQVSLDLRMPGIFRGDGVRGHQYHVFDEPRYFAESPDQLE